MSKWHEKLSNEPVLFICAFRCTVCWTVAKPLSNEENKNYKCRIYIVKNNGSNWKPSFKQMNKQNGLNGMIDIYLYLLCEQNDRETETETETAEISKAPKLKK